MTYEEKKVWETIEFFTLATYFVAHAAVRVTEAQLEEQLGFILKHLRLDKVYLEPFRGEMATHEQVEMCGRVFERHGIQVAGGLTTVMNAPEGSRPKARLFNTLCYNDPAMRQKLKEVSAFFGAHLGKCSGSLLYSRMVARTVQVQENNTDNSA